MSFDIPRHGKKNNDPLPSNQRIIFLEVLGQLLSEQFRLTAEIVPGSASGPAFLRVSNPEALDQTEAIGCDFTPNGWLYVWIWGDNQPIARVEETSRAAVAIVNVLGVR